MQVAESLPHVVLTPCITRWAYAAVRAPVACDPDRCNERCLQRAIEHQDAPQPDLRQADAAYCGMGQAVHAVRQQVVGQVPVAAVAQQQVLPAMASIRRCRKNSCIAQFEMAAAEH